MDTKRDELSELESDLRVTADDLAADAKRVAEIEKTKAALAVTDPRLPVLSEEAEALTAGMARKATMETALVREAQGTS